MSGRFIVLLAGKSGSGKSTVAEILAKKYGMRCASSYTTRKPRFEGEPGHIFVTDEEFDRIDPGEMVAYTEFAGYRYCARSIRSTTQTCTSLTRPASTSFRTI